MVDSHVPRTPVPTMQADATLSQNNPVSTTLYTVLATAVNVRIISITAQVTWTVQPSPLEIVVTIDGISTVFPQSNPLTATWYCACMKASAAAAAQQMFTEVAPDPGQYRAFLLEGRSVLIQARTTGGTVSNLSARVKYAKW